MRTKNTNTIKSLFEKLQNHSAGEIAVRAYHLSEERRLRGEAVNPFTNWLEADRQLREQDEVLAVHLARSIKRDMIS